MRAAPLAALTLGAAICGLGPARAQPSVATPAPTLAFPVACEIGRNCEIQHYVDRDPSPRGLDYRCGHQVEDQHDGVDIRLPDMTAQKAGVDVLAAASGRVIAIRDGVPDISVKAPGAPSVAGHMCGNRVAIGLGNGWILDYCHLAQGSLKVKVGDTVTVGQPLAHVGLSGSTEFPHLHFSVRHNNLVVDPFAPTVAVGCEAEPASLWTAAAARQMGYKRGAVLNTGFATGAVDLAAVENRTFAAPVAASAGILTYARLIGLEAGDVVEVTLLGPDGKVLAAQTAPPLATAKDEVLAEIGRKRPPQGWSQGVYVGAVQVRRAGAIALSHRWQMTL